MKEIDLETWNRRDIFNLYYQFDIPQKIPSDGPKILTSTV